MRRDSLLPFQTTQMAFPSRGRLITEMCWRCALTPGRSLSGLCVPGCRLTPPPPPAKTKTRAPPGLLPKPWSPRGRLHSRRPQAPADQPPIHPQPQVRVPPGEFTFPSPQAVVRKRDAGAGAAAAHVVGVPPRTQQHVAGKEKKKKEKNVDYTSLSPAPSTLKVQTTPGRRLPGVSNSQIKLQIKAISCR